MKFCEGLCVVYYLFDITLRLSWPKDCFDDMYKSRRDYSFCYRANAFVSSYFSPISNWIVRLSLNSAMYGFRAFHFCWYPRQRENTASRRQEVRFSCGAKTHFRSAVKMHICAARKCISARCEFEFSRLRKWVFAECENAFSRRGGNTGLYGNPQNLVFFCILRQRTVVATAKMQFRDARKSCSDLCENEFRNGEIVRSAPRESVFSRRAKMHFYTARKCIFAPPRNCIFALPSATPEADYERPVPIATHHQTT